MTRKRYPSDEKRARPYVRVHLTIRNHPKYAHVFADAQLRSTWLGVLVVARGAFAGETGDEVTLGVGDVCWITDTREIRYGLPRLRKLCAAMGWQLTGGAPAVRQRVASDSPTGRQWKVKVRNYKRKQGVRSATPAPPIPPTDTDTEKRESAPKRRSSTTVPPDAESFAEDFRKALVARREGFKEPTPSALDRWRHAARLMLSADGREIDEARTLAGWLFNDPSSDADFWRGVVLSVTKFRAKYDQMLAQSKRGKASDRRTGTVVDAASAASAALHRREDRR